MDKQIVHFSDVLAVEVGYSAIVFPTDHPSQMVSNTQYALTSPVLDILKGDEHLGILEFETHNTRYVREAQDDTPPSTN